MVVCYGTLLVVVFMLFGVSSECCRFGWVAIRCVWMDWVFGCCVNSVVYLILFKIKLNLLMVCMLDVDCEC